MNLLGLELCDAGILVAGGEPPRLLPIDGMAQAMYRIMESSDSRRSPSESQ